MILVVTGGRDFDDWSMVRRAFNNGVDQGGRLLVSGGAPGLDTIAHRVWTFEYDLPGVVVPAPWSEGKMAGFKRNRMMLDGTWFPNSLDPYDYPKADMVIAFPRWNGTAHCVRTAEELGIPVIRAKDL